MDSPLEEKWREEEEWEGEREGMITLVHWLCYCSHVRTDKSWQQPSQYYNGNSFDLTIPWNGLRNAQRFADHTLITTTLDEDSIQPTKH